MSSPAQGGPSVPAEKEKRGLGKVLSRMRTVLQRPKAKRQSMKPGPSTVPEETVIASVSAPAPVQTGETTAAADTGATKVPRSQIFEERAKKLAERYGLDISPSEWHKEGHALRVEKPIKMRVHRHCHECKAKGTTTSFGLVKECNACGHTRCKQCPRVPPKRTEAEKEASRARRAAILKERAENPPIIPDWNLSDKKVELRRPAKSGGQDLIYKKPRQRIRRTCCQEGCGKLFTSGSKTCECGHVRCTDCARDPAKKDKYPYGYPGDQPGKKLGHFECRQCKYVFSTELAPTLECPKCNHNEHSRLLPRKVEPEPDPEVWKAVQARLEGLKIT